MKQTRERTYVDLSKLDEYKEGNRLEVKAAQGGIPDSIWETVSAFANTSGGVIVLGVKDRKGHPLEVTGLPDAHKMLDDFWNAALSKDKLSARFLQDDDARIEDVGGKEVIVIEVPRVSRLMRPVFLKKDILGETWRRTHTGDHRCAREEVQSMLRDAESSSEDSRIAENVKMDHIDSETVRRYRVRFSEKNANHIWNAVSDEEFLEFIGAAKKDKEGVLRPTRAGILMFGQDCWITYEFTNYFLDYRQETASDTRWEDRFASITGDWSGNIYDFYIKVYNKLKAALKVPFKLEGIERVDDTPAHEALREAIVNCVTNANYYERRGIVCVWRDEALTIANPGDFRIPLEKAMRPGESDPRNATMLKMFAMIDAGERAGSGISKILHGWKEAGYAAPSYSEECGPDRTILMLPLQKSIRYDSPTSKDPNGIARLTENEKEAIRIVGKSGKVTTRSLVDATGMSRKAASALLKRLSNRGYLQWHGSSNNDPEQYYSIGDDQ